MAAAPPYQMSETTPLLITTPSTLGAATPVPATSVIAVPATTATQQLAIPGQTLQIVQRVAEPETPPSKKIKFSGDLGIDPHSQFCALTGCPPTDTSRTFTSKYRVDEKTLYGRVKKLTKDQNLTYQLTSATTNALLFLQIVLGAILTGLGGTSIPRWVITAIGATNTIIAGLVAYLKSRGQPMRARMFRDDLERVMCEIENSEVMWLGISKNVHGYDDIDTSNDVTVRSEVARLTRLFDKAIKNNTANNPDTYAQADTKPESKSQQSSNTNNNTSSAQTTQSLIPVTISSAQMPQLPSQQDNDFDDSPAKSRSRRKQKEDDEEANKKSVTFSAAADKGDNSSSTATVPSRNGESSSSRQVFPSVNASGMPSSTSESTQMGPSPSSRLWSNSTPKDNKSNSS